MVFFWLSVYLKFNSKHTSDFDFRNRQILTVWVYDNKWYDILQCHIFFLKTALLTQTVFQWMKYVRGWQLISQPRSSSAGRRVWAERRWTVVTETGSIWGSMGLRMDRMESVNQRGPWWPERTADLPELVARWWEHRYLSHYHWHWWTHTPLTLCLHDGWKTPHL